MNSEDYHPDPSRGEPGIYCKGVGFATARKFIKILVVECGILVEGFVDLYGKESGLRGFVAAIPKSTCKKVVGQIIQMIQYG